MAGARRGSGRALALILGLLLVVLVVWDVTGPDSVLRSLFNLEQSRVSDNARDIFESARPGN